MRTISPLDLRRSLGQILDEASAGERFVIERDRRPLEADFGHDRALLEHEIRVTVLHELAHYFGIDEQRLAELGYA